MQNSSTEYDPGEPYRSCRNNRSQQTDCGQLLKQWLIYDSHLDLMPGDVYVGTQFFNQSTSKHYG